MMLLLLACSGNSGSGWTAPVFEGDGLPRSEDTEHDDPRRDADTSGGYETGRDTGTSGFPEFDLTNGLFAYQSYYGYIFGFVVLSSEAIGCLDGLSGGSEGVYYYLLPGSEGGELLWTGEYEQCGNGPCLYYGYWTDSSGYGYVSGGFSIESYDAHYVTFSFDNEIDADTLTVYNCGDVANWNY